MKFPSLRVALVSAGILVTPLVTLAGTQPKMRRELTQNELQDRTGITRAVQLGKGSGITRYDLSHSASAYRLQTPEDQLTVRDDSRRSNRDDAAFRK